MQIQKPRLRPRPRSKKDSFGSGFCCSYLGTARWSWSRDSCNNKNSNFNRAARAAALTTIQFATRLNSSQGLVLSWSATYEYVACFELAASFGHIFVVDLLPIFIHPSVVFPTNDQSKHITLYPTWSCVQVLENSFKYLVGCTYFCCQLPVASCRLFFVSVSLNDFVRSMEH